MPYFIRKHMKKKIIPIIIIAAILAGVLIVWLTNPMDYEVKDYSTISYVKAKVISVNSQSLEPCLDLPGRNVGKQNVTVRFTEGKHEGKEITIDNILSSTHSIQVSNGTRVILKCDEPEGITPNYSIYNYDRTIGMLLAFGLFLAVIGIVGKAKGLRAALALIISIIIIAFALIPTIYNGSSPVLVTLFVCIAISLVTLILLNGLSIKTWIAILSAVVGLTVSAVFYLIISEFLKVTGYSTEETESLIMIARGTNLKISQILFSGILLSSLGAVLDTSMSIASSLFEITQKSPKIKKKELFDSGLNIGRDMIGTMCQTLVLAFTGGAVASLLIMVSYGTKLNQFLSSDFLAVEILQALTGSLAVILTVPITASICAALHTKSKNTI